MVGEAARQEIHDAGDRVVRSRHVRTFEDNGVLTGNRGLVVTLGNGQEFQLTIVESSRR